MHYQYFNTYIFIGDIVYKNIIKKYLEKLTINDLLNYANQKNIKLSQRDAIILLTYAKKYLDDLLNGKEEPIFQKLKKDINPETYKEVYKMFIDAKIKYL